ncbi:hypothetical protein SCBWM1_gp79 [Synechococcus phage S-CBWM1]|uniref:Uncharacterized protein n=1 Tax=Synechococcus phage S-CBWM1 TaxID=2053653 RepID=A0A3G1L3K2_9CAUD|nr:hypothetical protein HOU61_gp118 [Synechococcus phage S-CBWM1]ATW62763.1 hypothetical protein SCBWM1_gp79 [Synechococcus phage S-CBWM1]
MRNISAETPATPMPEIGADTLKTTGIPERLVFTATLSNGRVVKAREMTGKHFVYMESPGVRKHGNTKKMAHMVSELALDETPISIDEIEKLPARDLAKIAKLFGQLSGMDAEDDEEEVEEEELEFPK